MQHTWYNQNEDHKSINDESSVEFENGTLTLTCNDESETFQYTGEPVKPEPAVLKKLEEWPVGYDRRDAEEVCNLFGVKLV